ncbi:MAG: adenylosuccinate synthase [Deltaproteobacteria bacterium]|nr:adenylosuccinate synthase [Deltaproteobacteria bacterium]
MAVVVIVGAQWGDEGKGKVVDLYTEHADVVARFGGGPNAGHTLVVDGNKLVTHLIPSGVLRAGKKCVLGDGMVVDPQTLLEEIAGIKSRGYLVDDGDLLIGERAHVILPYHRRIDQIRESRAGAIGTTKRGIGPAYEAKVARRGIRMADLLRPDRLRALVAQNLDEVNPYLERLGGEAFQADIIVDEALRHGESLRRYIADASRFVHDSIRRGQSVLFEGAQGALLDVDHGTYPFVTSSSTLAGGACTGLGIGPTSIHVVIGITKAYATRVGGGPFPTELDGTEGERLRDAGAEFGSTTGRPRRCGWLDIPGLRLAVRINGMAGLALTKLDVLKAIRPIKMCVAYRLGGKLLDEIPQDPADLAHAEPVFETLDGWSEDIRDVRDLDDLPPGARRYLARIEDLLGVPLYLVSVGPSRAETIVLKNPFRAERTE